MSITELFALYLLEQAGAKISPHKPNHNVGKYIQSRIGLKPSQCEIPLLRCVPIIPQCAGHQQKTHN